MKETPILFSGTMVRAILDGSKTQTRRVCKSARASDYGSWADEVHLAEDGMPVFRWKCQPQFDMRDYRWGIPCPYGKPGDRLWVRETWRIEPRELQRGRISHLIDYAANPGSPELTVTEHLDAGRYSDYKVRYRPSIHMPRWASRISLEVVSVRVERVQDISEADAWAEGVHGIARTLPYSGDDIASVAFSGLWREINGTRYPWESNPWVWVVQFNRV